MSGPATPGGERAALGEAFDLLAAYPGHGGFLIDRGSRGVAAGTGGSAEQDAGTEGLHRLSASALARLRSRDDRAVAVGVVPFDPSVPATVRVPDVAVRRTAK